MGPRPHFDIPLANGRRLELGRRPLVMGILNVTPDSFADSTPLQLDIRTAIDRALSMEAEGADIIDVGGESTRPGAEAVDAETELRRVLPVIEALVGRLRIPMSVDTYKAVVADAVLAAGANMINDVSGLVYDPALATVVVRHGASIVLMHTRGRSKDMYQEAEYGDVMADVTRELGERVSAAMAAGIPTHSIVVDPGIGFAKRVEHSYGVLARLHELAVIGRPILVGPSRKSFMRAASGGAEAVGRDWTTAAAVTASVLGGAHIVRVHAVASMVHVIRAAEQIRQAE